MFFFRPAPPPAEADRPRRRAPRPLARRRVAATSAPATCRGLRRAALKWICVATGRAGYIAPWNAPKDQHLLRAIDYRVSFEPALARHCSVAKRLQPGRGAERRLARGDSAW